MPDTTVERGGGGGTATAVAPPPPAPRPQPHPPPPSTLSIVDNVHSYTSHCGYCETPGETSASVGMWAHALSAATYNALVDAGWRRSGRWVYRPLPTAAVRGGGGGGGGADASSTRPPCCVAHTIRLDVRHAARSRAQRRCLARVAAFLDGGPLPPPTAAAAPAARPASAANGASPATAGAAWAAGPPPGRDGPPALVLPLPRAAATDAGPPSSPPRCPSPRGVSPVVGGGGPLRPPPAFAWPPTTRRRATEEGGGAAAAPAAAPPPPPTGAEGGGPVDAAALAARLLREAVPATGADRKRKAGDLPVRSPGGSPAPGASPARAAVAAALASAAAALLSGSADPSALPVAPPKPGPARRLPPTVALTSPAGLVLAARLKRASGSAHKPPAALATALATALTGGGGLPPGWSVRAEGGHLNFHAPSAEAAAAERGGGGGLPAPPTTTSTAQPPLRAVRSRRSWPSLADAAAVPPSSVSPPRRAPAAAAAGPPAPPVTTDPPRRRSLEIRTVPVPCATPAETDALIAAEFPLFVRYQTAQHGDDPAGLSTAAFRRFLVDTPLLAGGGGDDGRPGSLPYGSAHQQYWLDGSLIAVGVVDVLPRGLSSVYFFWEPGLGGLGLGRWSALQEIEWVKDAAAAHPAVADAFRFYYMGYYIHTCPKMRYKAEFAPSELLAVADGEVAGHGEGGGDGGGGGGGSGPADPAAWPPPPLVWVPAADGVRLLDADARADLRVLAGAGGRASGGGGGGGTPPPPPPTLPFAGPPLAPLPAVLQTLVFAGSERGGGNDAAAAAGRPRAPTTVTRLGRLAASGGLSRPALAGLVDRLRPWVAAIVAAGVQDEVVVLV